MSVLGCGLTTDTGASEAVSAQTAGVTISGRLIGSNGGGLAGATIVVNGSSQATIFTNVNGSYAFVGSSRGSYSLHPSRSGCTFSPDTANLNNISSPVVQDFIGSGTSCLGNAKVDGGLGDAGATDGASERGGKIPQFALLSSGPIALGDRAQIDIGAVGTAARAAGSSYTLAVRQNSRIPGDLYGIATQLLDRAVVGSVSADRLSAPAASYASLSPFVSPPAVPQATAAVAGSKPVSVPSGTQTLPQGKYGAITDSGTLVLSGGLYEASSLTLNEGATLRADAPSTLRIAQSLTAKDRAVFTTASGLQTSALRLVVTGGGSAVTLRNDVHIQGLILAPSGSVTAADRWVLNGAIAAQAISTGADTVAKLETGFACSVDAECDDHNECTQDACSDGFCVNGALSATPCNDGSACTRTDVCQAGVCRGTDPVVCVAMDQCHTAGICDPANGQCSTPVAPDRTPCDDGNACTQTDVCQAGMCVGSNPVLCTASDACHVAGACDPATGACSSPAAPDSTSCDDGNQCTKVDLCQAGICRGTSSVVCTASDACHVAGACDPATGACSNPAAPDNTSCDDGNPCTQGDLCQGGSCVGSPVTCVPQDTCHAEGACDPATGMCSNPVLPDNTPCNDGSLCSQTDTCLGGECVGKNFVTCPSAGDCQVIGKCDPATGKCSAPTTADNGAACRAAGQSGMCTPSGCTPMLTLKFPLGITGARTRQRGTVAITGTEPLISGYDNPIMQGYDQLGTMDYSGRTYVDQVNAKPQPIAWSYSGFELRIGVTGGDGQSAIPRHYPWGMYPVPSNDNILTAPDRMPFEVHGLELGYSRPSGRYDPPGRHIDTTLHAGPACSA